MFRSLYPILRTENILLLRHNPQRGNKYIETCSWFVFSTRVTAKNNTICFIGLIFSHF
jgi:hypothetical protein